MDLAKAPEEIGAIALAFWTWAIEFLPRLGALILIIVAGFLVATWAARGVAEVMKRTHGLDRTLVPVIHAVVSAVTLQLRAWATTATFWDVRWDLTQDIKRDLGEAGIGIPFPQRVVRMVGGDRVPSPPRRPEPQRQRVGEEETVSAGDKRGGGQHRH